MTIVTKYNPGDTVYLVKDNQIIKAVVNGFYIQSYRFGNELKGVVQVSDVDIVYNIGTEHWKKTEADLFKTPEELFECLKSNIKLY